MNAQAQGSRPPIIRREWWHGYTFNATLGSRVQNTDTIKNGYFVCYDPEAVADGFAAPTANANAGDYTGTPPNTYPTDATYKAKMRVEGYNADRLYCSSSMPTISLPLVPTIYSSSFDNFRIHKSP